MSKNGLNIILDFFKKYSVVLLFAMIVGAASVAPHILAVRSLGTSYQGIPFLYLNNEFGYVSRIQEIADGHGFVGSPHFLEYKNLIPIVPPFGEYFYYALHLATGLTVPQTAVLAKFLFPALLFLLVYALTSRLSGATPPPSRNWGALAAGTFVTLGYDLVDWKPVLSRLLGENHLTILSLWTRPVNPIIGALVLFSFLLLVLNMIENRKRSRSAIGAGILLALGAGYFFSFALAWLILFLLALRFIFTREYDILKSFALSAGIAAALNGLYWLEALKSLQGIGSGVAERNGLLHFHTPILNKVLIAASAVFIVLCARYLRDRKKQSLPPNTETERSLWFCGTALLAGFIAFNQQIVTGLTIWPYHFVQYTIPLSAIAVIATCGNILGSKHRKLYLASSILITVCSLGYAAWNIPSYRASMEDFRDRQPVATFYEWLNRNAPKDCVVLVIEKDERVGEMLTALTHCNVYRSLDINSGVPQERILTSFFVKLRLEGIPSKGVEQYLEAHPSLVTSYFFADWDETFGKKTSPDLGRTTQKLAEEYEVFSAQDFARALSRYRLDYILAVDSRPEEIPGLAAHVTPIERTGNSKETFSLYRFTSATR